MRSWPVSHANAVAALAVIAGAWCRDRRPGELAAGAGPLAERSARSMLVDAAAGPATPPALLVPFTTVPLEPCGHFAVNVWAAAANTRTLLDERGQGAVPISEARFLWGNGLLYVFFHAADLDLQVRTTKHDGPVWEDDGVMVEFPSADGRKFVVDVSPTGVVADAICPQDAAIGDVRCDLRWESGVRVGTDYDGTINTLGDFDEEWAVEMALPLASIAVPRPFAERRVSLSLHRCEMAYDGKRACGSWGGPHDPGEVVLSPPGS